MKQIFALCLTIALLANATYTGAAELVAIGDPEKVTNEEMGEIFELVAELMHPYELEIFDESPYQNIKASNRGFSQQGDKRNREDGSTVSRLITIFDSESLTFFYHAPPDHDFGSMLSGTSDDGISVLAIATKLNESGESQISTIRIIDEKSKSERHYTQDGPGWAVQQYQESE